MDILIRKSPEKKNSRQISGLKRAKLQKERSLFKKELAKFEKAKNIGITKDLIKDLKLKIKEQEKIVKKALTDFNEIKKKTEESFKEYKKLRGSIFNRNYKKLKRIYKDNLRDQKFKGKDLKLAEKNLKRLKTEYRDAKNRLRITSSN